MKPFVRTISFATLLLSLAIVAAAQDGTCSPEAGVGTWGYTITGTLMVPGTGAVPFVVVGRSVSDADGNSLATQTSSLGGQISQDTLKGTGTLNPDCTTTFSVSIYDKSGNLLRTASWTGVYVDNGRELRAIMTSLVIANGTPNGMSVPAVVTMNDKKLSPATR